MEFKFSEPTSSRYIYINPETNKVHLLVPLFGGQEISTDNTCRTDIAIYQFNDTALQELKKYQAFLEFDLSMLPDESPLKQQKQSRQQQINDYIALVSQKKGDFISLREEILKKPSNLYGILLRPRFQDSYTQVQNPIFSLNRKNDSSGAPESLLFNSLQRHLSNIKFAKPSPKQQLLDAVLENKEAILSTNERLIELQQTLTEKAKTLFHTPLDFTTAGDGKKIDIDYLNAIFDVNLTEQEALDGLLGACAQGFFDTYPESPFYATSREIPEVQLEKLSIMTQFYLATINIYCISHGLTTVNFGAIFDGNQALSDELTQVIKQSLENGEDVENNICRFIEKHHADFQLDPNTPLNTQQIKEKFIRTYLTVKDSPHMDEFLLLDLEAPKENAIFVTHQGSICTDITLLVQEQELTETLSFNKLDFNDSHPNDVPTQNPSVSATDKLDIPLETLLETLANQNVNLNQYSGLIENIIEELFHACIENSLENPSQAYNSFCKIIGGKKPVMISKPPILYDIINTLVLNNQLNFQKWLSIIAKLPPAKQSEILLQRSSEGPTLLEDFLMMAARYHPQAVESILKAMEGFTQNEKFQILSETTDKGRNALIIAARYHPQAVESILKAMEGFTQNEKFQILSNTDTERNNALMIAAQYHPQAVEPILKTMEDFTQKEKFQILSQINDDGDYALMLAILKQPQTVGPILDVMQTFPADQIFQISSQTRIRYYGDKLCQKALMLAIEKQPQAIEPILKAMQTLPADQIFQILSQTDQFGDNALMLAIEKQPQAIEPILNAMQTFPTDQIFQILSQTRIRYYGDQLGPNALMLAIEKQPQAIEPILKAMQTFPADQIFQILSQTRTLNGFNILMMAASNSTLSLEFILKTMQVLTPEQKISILSHQAITANILRIAATGNPESAGLILYELENLKKYPEYNQLHHPRCLDDLVKENLITQELLKGISFLPPHAQHQLLKNQQLDQLKFGGNPIVMSFLKLNEWRPAQQSLKTKAAIAKIEQLSEMYQKEKGIIPKDINQYLKQIQLIKRQHKDLDARLLNAIVILEKNLIQQRELKNISWPNEAPFNEINDKNNILSILRVITPRWIAENSRIFKDIFQQFPLEWQNKLLERCYKYLPLDTYQRIFNHLSIDVPAVQITKTEESVKLLALLEQFIINDKNHASFQQLIKSLTPSYFNFFAPLTQKSQELKDTIASDKHLQQVFHLAELKSESKRLSALHDKVSDEKTRCDYLNIAMNLDRFSTSLAIYLKQFHSAQTIQEKQQIYQQYQECYSHYSSQIQQFETNYPETLRLKSVLSYPNWEQMSILQELVPEIPFDMVTDKNSLVSIERNRLLDALKSKNKEDISKIVEEVYQLSSTERLPILLACDVKLTSFMKDNPAKLYLLELERVKYQLQINNPKDPNIKVFNLLLLQLRANPENALDYLTQAQINFYRNLTWWQMIIGYFNKTGYGIGFLKDSIDTLLEQINEHMPKSSSSKSKM